MLVGALGVDTANTIVKACVERKWEFLGHGHTQKNMQKVADALALQEAGAFALVLEVVPSDLAERVTKELTIPTVGIGAGAGCDAQVLVWTDMAGLTPGKGPKFLKKYADLRTVLGDAVSAYSEDVREGRYPATEHGYS